MKNLSFILLISIFFLPEIGIGQSNLKVENDDLYFNSDDREVLNEKIALEKKREAEELKKSGYAYDQFESSEKNLNDFQKNENNQNAELNQAPPVAESSQDQGWYYDESAARRGLNPQNGQGMAQTQIYNYYGGMNPMMYGGFYDPFMFRPGFNIGFGFNSWGLNSWSVGYGRGFHDPFFDPYWGNPYAFGNPWRRPFGFGSYGWGYNDGFRDGFYYGATNHRLTESSNRQRYVAGTRTYRQGPRVSRSVSSRNRLASSRTSTPEYNVSRNAGTERSRRVAQANVRTGSSGLSSRSSVTSNGNVNTSERSIYSRNSRTAGYARAATDNNVRTTAYSGTRSRSTAVNGSGVSSRSTTAGRSTSSYYNSARTNRSSYSSGRSSNNSRSSAFGNNWSRSSSYGNSSRSSGGNSYGRSSSSSSRSSSVGRSSSSSSRSRSSSVGRSSSSSSRSSGSSSRSGGSSRSSSSSRGGRGG